MLTWQKSNDGDFPFEKTHALTGKCPEWTSRVQYTNKSVTAVGSYSSFLDMHAENSWGCANQRVPHQMIFLKRGLGRAAMGIAYRANYEQ